MTYEYAMLMVTSLITKQMKFNNQTILSMGSYKIEKEEFALTILRFANDTL